MTAHPALSYQGHYAGPVSRLASYVIDLVVSTGAFAAALALISYIAQIVSGHPVSWNRSSAVVAGIFVVWEFAYFGYSWAASGRTIGMGVLGILVLRADGTVLEPGRAFLRSLVFPLSFLFCGLGFLGIVVQREHRALHDFIAGTAVIYAWDPLSERRRALARR